MPDVIIEKRGHTAVMTLNRSETMNALCRSLIDDINCALDEIETDDDIYTVIITGTGKSFISGADISEMVDMSPEEIMEWSGLGSRLNLRLEAMSLPVIAAINGHALGGGLELALACDIRIASQNARMGLPEVKLGVICGAGGTQRLPAIAGVSLAREMLYTGRIIDADEALKAGIISRILPAEELLDGAMNIALSIERNGQLAVRAAKRAINFGRNSSIEDGCTFERKAFAALFDTEDQKIGMRGFLNKEKEIRFKNK